MMKSMISLVVVCSAMLVGTPSRAQDNTSTWPAPIHDNPVVSKFMLDRLELQGTDTGNVGYWEGQAYVGTDLNKLWLKTEGDVANGATEEANLELLYSRAVAAFWDLQAGVRSDLSVNNLPARNWAAVGVKGLAPYRFEVDATAYVGDQGRSAARFKAEYELLLTQRLVLMPEMEVNLYGKDDLARGLGSGLSNTDLGLRLRYDIRRELGPYIGVRWSRRYGTTADLAVASGGTIEDTRWVAGIRAWW